MRSRFGSRGDALTQRDPSHEQLLARVTRDARIAEGVLKLLRAGLLATPFISDAVSRDGFVRCVDEVAALLGFNLTITASDNHHIRFLSDLPVGCDPKEGPDDVTTN